MHAIIEGAVVASMFGEDARVKQRVIERRVETRFLAIGRPVYLQTTELVAPCTMQFLPDGLEFPFWDLFFEICAGLIDADEGSADADLYRLAGAKLGIGSATRLCGLVFEAIGPGVFPWRTELHDEVATEIREFERPEVSIHAMRIDARDLVPRCV